MTAPKRRACAKGRWRRSSARPKSSTGPGRGAAGGGRHERGGRRAERRWPSQAPPTRLSATRAPRRRRAPPCRAPGRSGCATPSPRRFPTICWTALSARRPGSRWTCHRRGAPAARAPTCAGTCGRVRSPPVRRDDGGCESGDPRGRRRRRRRRTRSTGWWRPRSRASSSSRSTPTCSRCSSRRPRDAPHRRPSHPRARLGLRPQLGGRRRREEYDRIKALLRGSDMVFIAAGAGGGTGTGAAPIVAQIARELGALTVGIVTRPFQFEGSRRRGQAEAGIAELAEEVDTLIVVPNNRLLSVLERTRLDGRSVPRRRRRAAPGRPGDLRPGHAARA